MTALLTDVLTLDKMEQGQFELTLKPACLECLVRSCARSFRPIAASRGLNLIVECVNAQANSSYQVNVAAEPATPALASTRRIIPMTREISELSLLPASPAAASVASVELSPFRRATITSSVATTPDSTTKRSIACDHSDAAVVEVDAVRLHQVLRNLLSNAFKFTTSGAVTVRLRYGNGLVDIEVCDTGIGMDEASLERLFSPYVQFANDLNSVNSSGLGLSIAKRLAQLHGGDLTCSSEKGVGSCFHLHFPLVRAAPLSSDRTPSRQRTGLTDVTTTVECGGIELQPFASPSAESAILTVPLQATPAVSPAQSVSHHVAASTSSIQRYLQMCESSLNRSNATAGGSFIPGHARSSRDELVVDVGGTSTDAAVSETKNLALTESIPVPADSATIASHPDTLSVIAAPDIKPTALVVDDAELNVRLLCRLLESRGWQTQKASNGQMAVDRVSSLADQRQLDLIFMDLNMPVMGGAEAIRLIRLQGYSGYIVGLTGDVSKESVDVLMNAGANQVMPKPFDVKLLDSFLSQWRL